MFAFYDVTNNNFISQNLVPDYKDLGDGWYRLSGQVTVPSTCSQFRFYPLRVDDSVGLTYFISNVQLEEGSFPTSVIPDGTTFTSRASTATYIDSTGTLQTAGVDVARDDAYGYVDGVLKPIGLLLEGAGTNLISNTNSSEGWNTFGLSILVGGATIESSQFINGIERVVIRLPAGARLAFTYPNSLNGTYTASARVRVISGYEFGYFRISMAGAVDFSKAITLSETVFSTISRTDFISGTGEVNIIRRTDGGEEDVLVEVEQQQLEESSFITSYIPTQGLQVTRAADVSASPQVTRAADSCVRVLGDEFNYKEGTFFIDLSNVTPATDSSFGRVFEISDGTGSNRIFVIRRINRNYSAYFFTQGVQANSYVSAVPAGNGDAPKIAISWKVGGVTKTYINGALFNSGTLNLPFDDDLNLYIGKGAEGSTIGKCLCKTVRFVPKALTEAELIALTGSD